MIRLLTTEKIPSWAICYFWNGEREGLTEEEEKSMLDWEDEMIEYARGQGDNFSGLTFDFHDGEDAEPYFSRCPAFGERNPYALPRRGEPPYLACDVYDVDIYANYN